jgi:hypothetical protein
MDRCTKLEEMCSNWILKPKLFIADDVLTQMKHRSRLLTIAVAPILFSRPARYFFQNNLTLRGNNTLCLVRIYGLLLVGFFLEFYLRYYLEFRLFFSDDISLFSEILNAQCICKYLCFQDAPAAAAVEGSLANRMTNKRKSVAIPVDFALRRYVRSADEVSHFSYVAAALVPLLLIHTHIYITFHTRFIAKIHITTLTLHYTSSF